MLILTQLVRDERTIARFLTSGDLDYPLDDILDEAAENIAVRDPELDYAGSTIEVIWIDQSGRSYKLAKSVSRPSGAPRGRASSGDPALEQVEAA